MYIFFNGKLRTKSHIHGIPSPLQELLLCCVSAQCLRQDKPLNTAQQPPFRKALTAR